MDSLQLNPTPDFGKYTNKFWSITKELAVVPLLFYLVHLAVDDSTSGVLLPDSSKCATEPLVMGPPLPAAAGK